MRAAGFPAPEYKHSGFMLYAALKNKTRGIENATRDSLAADNRNNGQVGDQAGEGADKLKRVLDFCTISRTKPEIQEYLGIKSDRFVRQEIIQPLFETRKLRKSSGFYRTK